MLMLSARRRAGDSQAACIVLATFSVFKQRELCFITALLLSAQIAELCLNTVKPMMFWMQRRADLLHLY
jgi:hypothetical protein